MWKLALPAVIYLCCVNDAVYAQLQFRVIKQWKYLNYTWPSAIKYANAVTSGLYVPENVLMAGITYYDKYFYVTMPRMRNGVPATLGRFYASETSSTAPLVEPFPSWDFNKATDCDSLQNVQNIEIDPNGLMYILDGGHTHSLLQEPVKDCPAQLVIFDIPKNETVLTYVFPQHVASQMDSFLYDLVVDGEYVYITDNSANDPGIVVFSKELNRSWKIRHPTMRGDPTASHFKVNNASIDVTINIAGIALGPKVHQSKLALVVNEDREVFYCPISSLHLYSISTAILRNESNSANGSNFKGEVRDVGLKRSQSDGIIMTNHGVLYYGLLAENSIAEWNSQTSFVKNQKVVSYDPEYIRWINAFTIDTDGTMTTLSNNLQTFVHGPLNKSRYNFWLMSAFIGQQSYLVDDPEFLYPVTGTLVTTTTAATTTTTKPTSNAPMDGQTDAGNRRLLEVSAILIAITVWVLNYD